MTKDQLAIDTGIFLNVWSSLLSVQEALFECVATPREQSRNDLARELRIARHRFKRALLDIETDEIRISGP
jgi:hypothetical protein